MCVIVQQTSDKCVDSKHKAFCHLFCDSLGCKTAGLTEVELIFFLVAGVRLCFGFVLKTMLIIQGYF